MPSKLGQRIKQTKDFATLAEEAMLNLVVASVQVRERTERVCKQYEIGSSHYNVLRILRGAPEEGYPRCDIIERMLDPAPDVTRLIDSLTKVGLVQRERCKEDRRRTMHHITQKGSDLLDAMQEDVMAVHEHFARDFSDDELDQLSRLCERIYTVDDPVKNGQTASGR